MSSPTSSSSSVPKAVPPTNGDSRAGSARARGNGAVPAVAHLTVAERVARGKAARAEVPRSSHANYEPPRRRRDPIKVLEHQTKTRVPEMITQPSGRILVWQFTFHQNDAKIMAS